MSLATTDFAYARAVVYAIWAATVAGSLVALTVYCLACGSCCCYFAACFVGFAAESGRERISNIRTMRRDWLFAFDVA